MNAVSIEFTRSFHKKVATLVSHQPKLRNRFKKQFALFKANPRHLSLRLHKLKGKRSEQYAIWIEGDLRAIAIKEGQSYIFFDLITHDQY